MRKEILPAVLLSLLCLFLFSGVYTTIVSSIGKLTPNKGQAEMIKDNQGHMMYANIAQKFTDDKYFWPRPSAVNYNAAGSAGSNKGPSNKEYLAAVQQRIDTFMTHNPGIKKEDIHADMVTASGSGLDPDISIQSAMIQAARIAKVRGIERIKVEHLIIEQKEKPLLRLLGPEKINVLKLNIALDKLSDNK